jgi:hypothetical protein
MAANHAVLAPDRNRLRDGEREFRRDRITKRHKKKSVPQRGTDFECNWGIRQPSSSSVFGAFFNCTAMAAVLSLFTSTLISTGL